MHRFLLPALGLLSLAACAPARTAPALTSAPTVAPAPALRAAFSDEGVVWVAGGRACVARAPSFRVTCPRLPRVADAAWSGPEAWAAVPDLGQIVTLDGAARSVPVGRAVALSAARVYREDGSAVTYAGGPARGVLAPPVGAVTGGNGEDYALVQASAGRQLVRVSDGQVIERQAGPVLVALPGGARSADVLEAHTPFGSYGLVNGRLERRDSVGRVLVAVPHGPGAVGQVGSDLVTVGVDGHLRRFSLDLREQ